MSEANLPENMGAAIRLFFWAVVAFSWGFEAAPLFWEGRYLESGMSFAIGLTLTIVLVRWQRIKLLSEKSVAIVSTCLKRWAIRRLRVSWYAEFYKAVLSSGLRKIASAFGSERPSFGGYLFCTVWSFIYILFGFIGVWALGGPGKIGETVLLPESWRVADRRIFALLLVLISVALYVFTSSPLSALQLLRKSLRRSFVIPIHVRNGLAAALAASCLVLIYIETHDVFLTALFLVASVILGVWLSCMVFFGGAAFGFLAAALSGAFFDGSHRFISAIAVISVVALGASHGTRAVAILIARQYRPLFARMLSPFFEAATYDRVFVALVFALVGASGGAVFVATVARSYAYFVGPEIDARLLESLGLISTSSLLPISGGFAGFIGGAFAARFGRAAIVCSSFIFALSLIAVLGSRVLSPYKLYEYFDGRTFVGAAMMNILLFFVILPPISAFWDWVGWEISRNLGKRLLAKVTPRSITLHILSDLIIATILLLGLTLSDVAAITGFNKWMQHYVARVPLPIDSLARLAFERPTSAEGLWITIMLFSTFLPALCHLLFVMFGILLIRTPLGWRLAMVRTILHPKRPLEVIFPVLYFSFVPLFGMVCVGAVAWFTFFVFYLLGAPISLLLYRLVHALAS